MKAVLEECRDMLKELECQPSDPETIKVFGELVTELRRLAPGIALLANRDMEIFELIGCGLSVKEIAERLHISPKTVETYRDRIRQKLKVESAQKLYFAAFHWMASKESQECTSE